LTSPPVPASIFSGSGPFQLINFNQDDMGNAGAFRLDTGYPDVGLQTAGLMSTNHTDQISMEIVTCLEFAQAGVVNMGVNSDDGFRVTAGLMPQDNTLELGVFEGGRGATTADPQSPFSFLVTQPGVYAFRMIWYEGNGAASVEWTVKDQSGSSHLVNDTGSPVKAYLARSQEPGGIRLNMSLLAGQVAISWDPVEGTLQSAPTVTGSWTDVTTVSPRTAPATGNRFFRVEKQTCLNQGWPGSMPIGHAVV
jgi:hypothetical protein